MSTNVLLLGSGGREHAIAWKLAQSPDLGTLTSAPAVTSRLTVRFGRIATSCDSATAFLIVSMLSNALVTAGFTFWSRR